MQKSFSFKGLTQNSDNMLVADGECMELVNLRYRDGCLLPISVPHEKELESVYVKFYWHSVAEMFLGIELSDECAVHFYDKDWNIVRGSADSDNLALFPQLCGVKNIEFVGNIVCCITNTSLYYIIYDAGSYRWLGERPQLPDLTISIKSIVYSLTTDVEYQPTVALDKLDSDEHWPNVSKGYFDECLAAVHSKGYYVDRAMFRFALRTYDGNYLCYSPIYFVDDDETVNATARRDKNFYSEPLESGSSTSCYVVKIRAFIPTFHFSNINLNDWENIVVGIDIFTSGSIYGHKVCETTDKWTHRNGVYYSSVRGFERYEEKSNRELLDDVSDAASFYKVAEYNLIGAMVDSVKDVSKTSLALCPALPDEDGSPVQRSAACSYVYNGSLHLGGVRETLFKAYNSKDYLPMPLEAAYADYAAVVTKINTSTGVSVVKKEFFGTFALGSKDGAYYMTPYIMYPDSRAYEITFIIKIAGAVYRKSFPLKRHKILNLASYVQSYGDGSTVTLIGGLSNGLQPTLLSAENVKAFFSNVPGEYVIVFVEGVDWFYGDRQFTFAVSGTHSTYRPLISVLNPVDGDTITIVIKEGDELDNLVEISDIEINYTWENLTDIPEIEEHNVCEVRGNVMKVSPVDNPFNFPAKKTYAPSHDDIVAMCSNTVALSQGQFGQHPLFLFCKDGIWAMTTDTSGSVSYATAHPLSREVCVNPASLCGIDSGVVFVSKKGLMLLQGGNLVSLSDALYSESCFIDDFSVNSIFYKIALLSYTQAAVTRRETVRDYLQNAVIGFLSSEKELWVSNSAFNYTYVFSLENRCWTKVNRGYSFFINCYPHVMANSFVDDKSYISVLHKDYAAGYAPFLLITRPQLWGTKLPKRILQFMLHASVKATTEHASYEHGGVGCYLLCSNDGVHFKLLSGVERSEDFNDIVFPFFPTQSYKYYVIALSGTMSVESRIVGAELSIECVWNNRLR